MAKQPSSQPQRRARSRSTNNVSLVTELSPSMARWLSLLAFLMVMGGAVLWLRAWISDPTHLAIEKVEWQGDFQYLKQAELEALAQPFVSTNLYLLDTDSLEKALEQNSWVRGASLRKVWPNQLVVDVETQFPVAFWGDDKLLNKFGDIFAGALPEKQGVFPILYSSQGNSGRVMGERYVQLTKMLAGLNLEIIELSEDERGSWRMKVRHGPEIIIGRKEQEKRVQRFRVGYLQGLKDRLGEIDQIDLRYTNGFAVEWKPSVGNGAAVSSFDGYTVQGLGS
ncbi:cell division protein FtsQ/DivIB [uncultured Thiothrix sp.]|uniref:cell division protein FtsQ/DivIB n=1 Tax=uncultured Thiothrix sp. TaxID=223185 RepID=UPI0026301805|nr:cell division protein FtsQ/DivIB [uncultured Thiothrix sp.]HMT91840.1 FtsQ-type POTRA domain-containing protein [Thiolinea sp.]